MIQRHLGKTGLAVSALGFGCGAVGGLLVRGEYDEMVRTVARAIEGGVTYFDTAALYGNGVSEQNLGRVLRELQADVVIGTKVRLSGDDFADIPDAVARSVDASLQRLQMERVELIQLHNSVAHVRNAGRGWATVDDVLVAAEALQEVVHAGKAKAWGINGIGQTSPVHTALTQSGAQTIQVCYNLLNPSAATPIAPDSMMQDYERLIDVAGEVGAGVIAIRVLAGGALSGVSARHPAGANRVDPIGTGRTYAEDVEAASRFQFLVDEGHVENLIEAAIRFAAYTDGVATALVGISNYEQLEAALTYVERGPLDEGVLAKIRNT